MLPSGHGYKSTCESDGSQPAHEDPPQSLMVKSQGLSVAPKTVLKVCDPAPNSGVLVLPRVIAPAVWKPIYNKVVLRWECNHPAIQRRPERCSDAACFSRVPCARPANRGRGPNFAPQRLHLVSRLRPAFHSNLRHESNDGIDFWIHPLNLLQLFGQSFARRKLLRCESAGKAAISMALIQAMEE